MSSNSTVSIELSRSTSVYPLLTDYWVVIGYVVAINAIAPGNNDVIRERLLRLALIISIWVMTFTMHSKIRE